MEDTRHAWREASAPLAEQRHDLDTSSRARVKRRISELQRSLKLADLNFTATAKKYGLTQPAVSLHVRKFEDSLGVTLIVRSGNKMVLTEAGRRAAEYGNSIVDLIDGLGQLGALHPEPQDVLGLAPDLAFALLQTPGGKKYLGRHQHVIVDTSLDLKRKFEEKALGLVARYLHDFEIETFDRVRVPMIWSCADDESAAKPLADTDEITIDLPPRNHPIHQAAIEYLKHHNVKFRIGRIVAEGVYVPLVQGEDQSRYVIPVPEFRLKELGRRLSSHPRLRDPLCVDVGVFGASHASALDAAENLRSNLDLALRNRCATCETPCGVYTRALEA